MEGYFDHVQSLIEAEKNEFKTKTRNDLDYSPDERKIKIMLSEPLYNIKYFYHDKDGREIGDSSSKYTSWALISQPEAGGKVSAKLDFLFLEQLLVFYHNLNF